MLPQPSNVKSHLPILISNTISALPLRGLTSPPAPAHSAHLVSAYTPHKTSSVILYSPDAHRTERITHFMLLPNLKYLSTLTTDFSRYLSLQVFLLFRSGSLTHMLCYVIFVSPVSSRVFGISVVLTKRLLHRLLTCTQRIHYINQVIV